MLMGVLCRANGESIHNTVPSRIIAKGVTTIGDECSRVVLELSTKTKRVAARERITSIAEDIV